MKNDRIANTNRARLTAESAFVVHFTAAATDTSETIQGRIEHITSGRATRFASSAELIAFMQRTLAHDPRSSASAAAGNHNDAAARQITGGLK